MQFFFFFSKPHVHKRALVSFPCSLEKEKASKQSHLHHTAELLKEMKERKGEEKKKKRVARRVRTELDAEKQKKKSVEESDNRGQFPFASRHSIESWVKPKKKKRQVHLIFLMEGHNNRASGGSGQSEKPNSKTRIGLIERCETVTKKKDMRAHRCLSSRVLFLCLFLFPCLFSHKRTHLRDEAVVLDTDILEGRLVAAAQALNHELHFAVVLCQVRLFCAGM